VDAEMKNGHQQHVKVKNAKRKDSEMFSGKWAETSESFHEEEALEWIETDISESPTVWTLMPP
jgi:hypothetical protein